MDNRNVITAKVFRFNPEKEKEPKFDTFMIPCDKSLSVLNLLSYIQHNLDQSLGYRNYFCTVGVCISCLLCINGKNLRGCTKTIPPGDSVTIEPAKGYKVIRDLVVDFDRKNP
jgi:succinate dehydrogenase / fumarate reductase iron-sulfur subunit